MQSKKKKKEENGTPTLITLKPFYRPHEKKGKKKKPETPPQVKICNILRQKKTLKLSYFQYFARNPANWIRKFQVAFQYLYLAREIVVLLEGTLHLGGLERLYGRAEISCSAARSLNLQICSRRGIFSNFVVIFFVKWGLYQL